MNREPHRVLVTVSLLALLTNGVNTFAQERKRAGKTATDAEMKGNLKVATGELKGELKSAQVEGKIPADGTFKFLETKYAVGKVLKGAPYSATAITEMIQKLGDGNQIIRKNESKVYRDSEGRTRIEQTLQTIGKWTAAGEAQQRIVINDAVAGFTYVLDPQNRTAHRRQTRAAISEKFDAEKLKAALQQHDAKLQASLEEHRAKLLANLEEEKAKLAAAPPEQRARLEAVLQERKAKVEAELRDRNANVRAELDDRKAKLDAELQDRNAKLKAEMADQKAKLESEKIARSAEEKAKREGVTSDGRRKTETLGKQVIEGVETEGVRKTLTIPAGEIGNTLPIEVIDESWYSPELQLTVMTKHSDPRSGETTYRLTNLNRSEPDRSLFEIPADYTVVGPSDLKKGAMKSEANKKPREL